jgi:putative restriction endonuclease
MSIVLQREEELSQSNYILHPERARDYWANISFGRLKEYLGRCGEAFNIVIVGNSAAEADFYAVPYRVLKSALVDEYRTGDKTGRVRWTAYIRHHQLKVGIAPLIDVGAFYGSVATLENPGDVDPYSQNDANDYAIENRKIEIEQRQKQSVFRKRVMENFEGRCCLTGISEQELLVAGHIVPWADRIDTRLDPSNGLLLYCPYDRLFDKGFISFDNGLRVILAPMVDRCSPPLRTILTQLAGQQARHPVRWDIKLDYLAYHIAKILRGTRPASESAVVASPG